MALKLHRAPTAGAQLGKHSFLLWLSVWTGNKEADQTLTQKAMAALSWNGVAGKALRIGGNGKNNMSASVCESVILRPC